MLPANSNYCGSCGFTVKKVFTTKDTKHALSKAEGSTKFELLIIRTLRVLRELRGEQNNLNDTHDPRKSLKSHHCSGAIQRARPGVT